MQNWLFFAFVLVAFYSYRYGSGILIPVAILLDGYYGNYYHVPYLSLMAIVWYGFVSFACSKVLSLRSITP
tara:strand:+ start:185 stop:397 length:213 start_codon:yes stop_codon:yes gene_type:complete